MGVRDWTVYTVLRRNAQVFGERTALVSAEHRITYGKFLERVNRLAAGLSHRGIEKGHRIGVLAKNSLEFYYLIAAAAKIGAILVPINWRLKSQEIEYILADSSPKALFVDTDFYSMVRPLASQGSFTAGSFSMTRGDGELQPFSNLMRQCQVLPDLDVGENEGYVIIYTAAVDGRPRGAVLTNRGLLAVALQVSNCFRISSSDANLSMLPMFHVAALYLSISAMAVGGSNVTLPAFDADLAVRFVQEYKISFFGSFPPMLKTLLDRAQELDFSLGSLKHVLGLDTPETINRLTQMTQATFWSVYGQTETSGLASAAPYSERPGSAGLPLPLAEVAVVDDYSNKLGSGKSGEIVVRGPMVFQRYWNLPKATDFTFRDGWHHTGDMGRLDEDGYLWFEGRAPDKELIKPGGENVYPAEVEQAILQHPSVREASVIGVPDTKWGEAIKAVCVLEPGKALTEAELIVFVAERIARFKKPKYVVFVQELPRSANGTVDRNKVRSDFGLT